MFLVLLFILILLLVTRFWLCRKILYQQAELFPGPKGLPLVGNVFNLMSTDMCRRFKNLVLLFQEFGNTVKIWIGPQLYILTTDPKIVEHVLKDAKIIQKDPVMQRLLKPFLGEGLITINGEKWKTHRKIVTSTFHMKIIEQFIDNFSKNSSILVQRLLKVAHGSPMDPYQFIAMCSLDVICETSMGIVVNAQLDSECNYVKHTLRSLEIFGERTIKPHLIIDAIYNMTHVAKEQKAASKYIHEFCTDIIKDKLRQFHKSGNTRTESDYVDVPVGKKMAFLDLLISHSLMSESEMLGEVMTLIFAGMETTSTACAFTLSLLGENQDVQDKIFEEQKNIFGDDFYRSVNSDDLRQMIYLEQVIKETLRLFPPVPATSRITEKDIPLDNGLTIPAGSIVQIFIYGLHRNQDFFTDPESFDPERFSPENCRGRHAYSYLPFGGGRRKCVGYNYAMLEAKTILSTILRRIKVTKTEGGIEAIFQSLTNTIVLKPSDGYSVRLAPRL